MMSNERVHKVRKPFDPVEVVPQEVGELVEKEYRLIRDSHMNCEYIEIGERNVRDYIESFKNGCSLKAILDRCSLMPTREKVAYVNQTENGLSADLSSMPTDGTAAQILIMKLKKRFPDFAQRIKNGESFESLVAQAIPNVESKADNSADNSKKEGEE